jgi:hypothetical protein
VGELFTAGVDGFFWGWILAGLSATTVVGLLRKRKNDHTADRGE